MDKDEKKKEKVEEPVVEIEDDEDGEPEGCGHCCDSCHLHDEGPIDTDDE